MRVLVCDFSVSSIGNEIEEIVMYDDENYTEEKIETFIKGLIDDDKLTIGERCEGSIEVDEEEKMVIVEYRYCSEVGDDWNTDEWEENQSYTESGMLLRLT